MNGGASPSWRFLAAWSTTSVSLLLLFVTWKFGVPVWQLPRSLWLPFTCLAAAFVVSFSISALLRPTGRWQTLWLTTVSTTAIFGVVFLGFIVTKNNFPRTITVAVFLAAVVLVPAPYLTGASRLFRAIALGALLATVVAGWVAPSLTAQVPMRQTTTVIRTVYYNINVETYSGAFPKSAVRGGALARIGDRYLQLSGDGHLHVFGWEVETDRLKITPLPYRVLINGGDFAAAAGRPWAIPPDEWLPQEGEKIMAAAEVLNTEWFRAYALLVQETRSSVRVFVSHPYWYTAQQCWVERVSILHSDRITILRGAAGPEWNTLYETTPCLPVRGGGRRHGIPFVGYLGGGRMALLDEQTLLLAVGDFGFDGVASVEAQAQNPATSYGKTLRSTLTTAAQRSLRSVTGIRRASSLIGPEPYGPPSTARRAATN